MKKSDQLKKELSALEEAIKDPKTPQGDVRDIQNHAHRIRSQLRIVLEEEYESMHEVSVYGSDDYVGASAGEYSFYFGYEVTSCPIKSHKTDDDCYDKDCDKREWVFQVSRGDKVIFQMLDSELSYPRSDDIERKLIVGMAHFIKNNIQ